MRLRKLIRQDQSAKSARAEGATPVCGAAVEEPPSSYDWRRMTALQHACYTAAAWQRSASVWQTTCVGVQQLHSVIKSLV